MVGAAGAGEIKGGAVVGAGAGKGKAEGDIHAGVEGQQFERDEALVVIHAEHAVELSAGGAMKNSIGRVRAGDIALGSELRDSRTDEAFFLVAEASSFTGVGIQSGHGQTRGTSEPALEKCHKKPSDADDLRRAELRGHVAERNVNGGKGHGERAAGEAHGEVLDAGSVGEELRLTGKGKADGVKGLFVHGTGDDTLDGALLQKLRGFLHGVPRGAGGFGGRLTRGEAGVPADESVFDAAGNFGIGEAAGDQLGTDAGGVTGSEAEDGSRGHAQ